MRLFVFALLLQTASLFSQSSPHPEYRQRYYLRISEGRHNPTITKQDDRIQLDGFVWSTAGDVNVPMASGYDSLFTVPEYNIPVGAFLASSHEVSNAEYQLFVRDSQYLSVIFRQADTNCLAQDETETWKWTLYKQYYFTHQAYAQYPVIGISHTQALEYCHWLQWKLEEDPSFMQMMHESLGPQAKFTVDLPSLLEYQRLLQAQVFEPYHRSEAGAQYENPVLEYLLSPRGNRSVNWSDQGLSSNRGANLMPWKTPSPFTVSVHESQLSTAPSKKKSYKTSTFLGLSEAPVWGPYNHLLGNVSEWTSTPAENHLFDNITYTLNTADEIIVNQYQIPTESLLQGRLHKPVDRQTHFAVWGGSWSDELYYLQGSAAKFKRFNHRSSDIGFRPIIRFYNE
jgi:formylglycine-generating enzyme required for sulfatase activity